MRTVKNAMIKIKITLPLVLATVFAVHVSSAFSDSNLDLFTSVKGPDANNNGVRDDIDAFIQKSHADELKRRAATQYAASLQQLLMVDKSDPVAVRAVDALDSRANLCLLIRLQFEGDMSAVAQTAEDLHNMTTNTAQRLQAYRDFYKAIDGWPISRATGDACD